MKCLKHTLLLACTILTMVGCLDNNTGTEIITEPTVKSEYYIANQSGSDLNVTYKMASTNRDSTITIPADSTIKIFESASIGGDTPPSSALSNLSFYKKSDDTTPLLMIEPIVNENWNRTAGEVDNVTKFELVVTEEDIK